jgi:hypothetical protein
MVIVKECWNEELRLSMTSQPHRRRTDRFPRNSVPITPITADQSERIGDDDMADERAAFGFDESGMKRDVDVIFLRYNPDAEYGVINGGRKKPSGNSRSKQPAR